MNTLRYFGLALLLLVGPTSPVFAQTGGAGEKLEKMMQELNLTPRQKLQAAPILKQHAQELEALKSDTSMKGLQKLRRLQQSQENFRAKLNPILNPEQQHKLAIMQEENRKEMIQSRMH